MISIITIVRHDHIGLRRTLKWLRGQTLKVFECIIINGGEDDETANVIKTYGKFASCVISEFDEGINPSLFEGLSTTVEEAKLMGKRLLISDIPVHREQAGMLGTFFNPLDGSIAQRK